MGHGCCQSGGRGWDNPEKGQKKVKWCIYGKQICTGLLLGLLTQVCSLENLMKILGLLSSFMGIRVWICLNIFCLFNVEKYKPPIKKNIQLKYAPSKPQSQCANNAAASAFRTREQNTQHGTSSSPGAWTLISKQPNKLRKMLKIYFPRVH